MSENIHHLLESAEKKLLMSPKEIRQIVKNKIMPEAQEQMKNSLEQLAVDPVKYLRILREELLTDLEKSGELINLIDIVAQDLKDCIELFDKYKININENSSLHKYLLEGLYSEDGDGALFSLLKNAGYTFDEVSLLFKEKEYDTASRKMENAVSLNRLNYVYQ